LARGSRRVAEFLADNGLEAQVVTLDDSTRTSKMAADALGCTVSQIAKSIVFTNGAPLVVVISSLGRFEEVWAAAGTPHSVMKISVEALRGLVGGGFMEVAKQ